MADLQFTVDYKQVKEANKEILKVGSNAQKSASVFEAAFKKAEAQSARSARAVREQIASSKRFEAQKAREANASARAVREQIASSNRFEAQKAREANATAAAAAKVAAEENRVATSYRQLTAAINPTIAAQQRMKQAHDTVRAALAAGIITRQQAAQSLREYRKAQVASNSAMTVAKNRMSGNNVAIQQLGYQVGDFAVQVQGGTSAFVAFSQQGAQLAGILPLIASPLGLSMNAAIGLSAAFGILIPVGSALARMFFDISGSAEKTEDALGNTVTAINDYRRSVEFSKKTTEELNREFGESSNQLERMQDLLQSVAVSRAMDGLATGTSMFGQELDEVTSNIKNIQASIDNVKMPTKGEVSIFGESGRLIAQETIDGFKADMEDAANALGLLPQQALDLDNALANISKSKDMEGIEDSALAALEVIKGMGFAFGQVPIPIAEVVENLENVAASASRATHEVNKITDAEQELLDLTLKISKSTPYIPMSATARAAQEANARMVDGLETAMRLKEQIGEGAYEALRLAGVDMTSGIDSAAMAAARLAADLNISLAAATAMSNMTSAEELASSQDVVKGSAADRYDADTLLGMGYTKEYLLAVGKIKEDKKAGGQRESKLEAFISSIETEREALSSWYSEQNDLLSQFNESELSVIGGQAEAKLRIEQEYQSRLQAMRNMQLSDSASFFGALANVASAGGQKMVKAVQVFSAAQALINSYVAYTEVLKDPSFIGRPFARFAAAAGVLGAGLNMVRAIKGAGSGGSSSAATPSGADAALPAAATAAPQRVIIEGIDRNSLISGEQLSNIFEALYKENENRGFVFEVAR